MPTKAEVMAALLAKKDKQGGGGKRKSSNNGDNASYPFWDIQSGEVAVLRFLPDLDPENTFFWVERNVIKMPFSGIVGGDYPTQKPVTVTVPCMHMWNEPDYIINECKPWWKDPAMEDVARTYWKKRTFILQGFVVKSPFEEETPPENPIRRFVLNKKLFEKIEKVLMDPEFPDLPTDAVGGTDFKVEKKMQGKFPNYDDSGWARNSRSLSEEELIAIETHGLFDLKQYLGRKPDADEQAAIKAMFKDSRDGQPFDVESYGQWFRAYAGRDEDAAAASLPTAATAAAAPAAAPAARPAARPVEEAAAPAPAAAPAAPPAEGGTKPSAHEILERIKNRTMQK